MSTTMHEAASRLTARTTDELARTVLTATGRQVQGLHIDCRDGQVTVTGRSHTYYAKQLVTHAIRNCLPAVALHNEILVAAR